ncbi:MAG: stage II sporulation protein D [Ruminococcus sp.]|nr:stage II sporulation protein D [Ruminococcus sp.]
MKQYFSVMLILSAAVAVLPAVPVWFSGSASSHEEEKTAVQAASEPDAAPEEETVSPDEPYRVLDISTGNVIEVPVRDYVIGAVCAEMPASFDSEALKAQAVAAHTYAERQRRRERKAPDPELKGADFSNDTAVYQGFFTAEQARQCFGTGFDESYNKIAGAVDVVLPYIITYEDEPIISAFHSMSSGRTESAENVWGAAVDYLVPVDSGYDRSAPKYREEVRYGRDVLREKLTAAFPGIVLPENISEWIAVDEVSDSGTVLTASAGDKKVTGSELRSALGLRSACFEVRCEGEETVFTTRGFGHGVGMSQYGAAAMAADGKSWKDILWHYYTGCEISEIKQDR